jgi:hypothetical protein
MASSERLNMAEMGGKVGTDWLVGLDTWEEDWLHIAGRGFADILLPLLILLEASGRRLDESGSPPISGSGRRGGCVGGGGVGRITEMASSNAW